MTTEDLFEDLKQFINAKIDGLDSKIDGAENRLDAKTDSLYHEFKSDILELKADTSELKQGLADIDTKLDTIMGAVGEDIDEIQSTVKTHEKRITKLEVVKAA